MNVIPIGRGEIRRCSCSPAGQRIAILAFGSMVGPGIAAGDILEATVANMRFVKPLDIKLIEDLERTHDVLVTIEEGSKMGGAGSACLEFLASMHSTVPVLVLGLPDHFIEHGDSKKLLSSLGLDTDGIVAATRGFVKHGCSRKSKPCVKAVSARVLKRANATTRVTSFKSW